MHTHVPAEAATWPRLTTTKATFQQGARDFDAGKKLHDNPHDFGTDAHDAWKQGWEEELAKTLVRI